VLLTPQVARDQIRSCQKRNVEHTEVANNEQPRIFVVPLAPVVPSMLALVRTASQATNRFRAIDAERQNDTVSTS